MNLAKGILLSFLIMSSIIAIPFQYSSGQVTNSAPDLFPILDQKEDEEDTTEFYFTATDDDPDDSLTFTSSPLPPFAVLVDNGDGTAQLALATSCSDQGFYQITITVTDDGAPNLSDSETFDLEIHDDCDLSSPEDLADRVIRSDVNDNVVVSYGEIVVITDTVTIGGNLFIEGGMVILKGASTISGNIEGSNGASILIEENSIVEGSVNILVDGQGGVLEIYSSSISGNIQTQDIYKLIITDNYISGNIYSTNDETVIITGNTINGNLEIIGPTTCTESSNNVNGNNSGCT